MNNKSLLSLTLLLTALCLSTPATTAVPAAWQFTGIPEAMPASDFLETFQARQLSIATVVNNQGNLIGYWQDEAGVFHGFNMVFGTNPAFSIWDTPNFLHLAAGDARCIFFFCSVVIPYGIRIEDQLVSSAFLTTVSGTSPLPGSLPFSRFPGNFVDSNAAGIIATTQLGDGLQFGAILYPDGVAILEDIPWLVAINDLAEPLVLGYAGSDGNCALYGTGCDGEPETCHEEGDGHQHTTGQGHQTHGQGYGYGHDPCKHADTDTAAARSLAIEPTGSQAVLIRLLADRSTVRYGFSAALGSDWASASVSRVFPLALNNSTAILRGDVLHNGVEYHQQLLTCTFDSTALDVDLNGQVDCIGGLRPLLPLDDSLRFATVLGFALNHDGLLTGNLGYSRAGVGTPVLVDTTQATPVARLAVNAASGTAGWELNTITDTNNAGKLVGYGYRDCSASPDAFFLTPATASGSDLGFTYGDLNTDTVIAPGSQREIVPQAHGGSGSYMFRYLVHDPALGDWIELQSWTASGLTLEAGSEERDLCLQVQLADVANPDDIREQVIRFSVTTASTSSPSASPSSLSAGQALADTLPGLGSFAAWWLMLILLPRRGRRTS